MTLEDLRDALKVATGPDGLLDRQIFYMCKVGATFVGIPLDYTASIDAAAALVPKEMHWSCGGYTGDAPRAYAKFHEINLMRYAATPALSICLCRVEYELMRSASTEDPMPEATLSGERGWMN